ncbi:MAG: hypothetical protein ABL901_18675 [Hyphomicrobiaceae bacterium]|nr:hypothetical protein [Hyphomicrobiaceae bacterium]
MATKPIKVKQPDLPSDEVPLEVLATAIVSIAEGVKAFRKGPLTDKAILLLIQNAAPNLDGRPIPIKVISAVLEGAESLAKVYLKSTR